MAIRFARKCDCANVLAVMFDTDVSRESTWWKTTVAQLEQSLNDGHILVFELNGEIVGCVGFRQQQQSMLPYKLAVKRSVQSRGIGRKLVGAVEEFAKTNLIGEVLLAVSQANLQVVPFYEKLGYQVTNRAYPMSGSNRPLPVVMTKRLFS